MTISTSPSILKPKAPLNEYNLFFLLERKRILDCKEHEDLQEYAEEELSTIIREHKTRGRRQHRRAHGKIGFRELARTIASRWKQLDMTQRAIFERRARTERMDYQVRLEAWEATIAQQEAASHSSSASIQYFQDSYVQLGSEDPMSRLRQLQELQASIEAEMARTMLTQVSMELPFKQQETKPVTMSLVPQEPIHPPIIQSSNLFEASPSSWFNTIPAFEEEQETLFGDTDLLQDISEQEFDTLFD